MSKHVQIRLSCAERIANFIQSAANCCPSGLVHSASTSCLITFVKGVEGPLGLPYDLGAPKLRVPNAVSTFWKTISQYTQPVYE